MHFLWDFGHHQSAPVFHSWLMYNPVDCNAVIGVSGAGWPIFLIFGPHEIISFRKWKINPQTDRVNKYATLIPNQVWMN